ncbi:hypothetical protein [Pseudonocardia acaciae]|uniref:hypothetical protein n=1 Tax=Pseudonocardia acaciae TaxID=551276 RepID=UPI000ADAE855|nr:hypothetical protein [Pseudonocardia acaciae]
MSRGGRLWRYLGSAKNLVGSAGGLVGLGLHLVGVIGWWWPAGVAALYAAGALLAPPPADVRELAGLRRELERLHKRAAAEVHLLPRGAATRVDDVAALLRTMLAGPEALDAHPAAKVAVVHAVSIDLPELIDHHLALPTDRDRAQAAHRFTEHLDAIIDHLTGIAKGLGIDTANDAGDRREVWERRAESVATAVGVCVMVVVALFVVVHVVRSVTGLEGTYTVTAELATCTGYSAEDCRSTPTFTTTWTLTGCDEQTCTIMMPAWTGPATLSSADGHWRATAIRSRESSATCEEKPRATNDSIDVTVTPNSFPRTFSGRLSATAEQPDARCLPGAQTWRVTARR